MGKRKIAVKTNVSDGDSFSGPFRSCDTGDTVQVEDKLQLLSPGNNSIYLEMYHDGTNAHLSTSDGVIVIDGASSSISPEYLNVGPTAAADFNSIKTACDSITDSSAAKPYYIDVSPGTYIEQPFTIPSYTVVGGQSVAVLITTDNDYDFITLDARATLAGFNIVGPTSAICVLPASGVDAEVTNCQFTVGETGVAASGLDSRLFVKESKYFAPTGTGQKSFEQGTIVSANIFSTSTTGYHCVHSGSNMTVSNSLASEGTTGLYAEDGGHLDLMSITIEEDVTTGLKVGSGGNIHGAGVIVEDGVANHLEQEFASGILELVGSKMRSDHFSVLDWDGIRTNHIDMKEGDPAVVTSLELAVGSPELGREAVFGEGDSYTKDMVVITTDSTAGAAADGGNLTDVSTSAQSASASTFSFQGVTDGHSILFGSNRINVVSGNLKFYGIKVLQTTATTEVAPKSYAIEIWTGAAWTEVGTMATHSSLFHRYGNELFIRSNISEHIRFGVDGGTTWVQKTIDSKNLYWARIRIATTVTTSPVFQQFKLSTSRSEKNADGTDTYHGNSRFEHTVLAAGNIFGEEGAVGDVTHTVGAGGAPTQWDHNIKNSNLNTNGDAVHFQFTLPYGIDTSFPMHMYAKVLPTGNPGANVDFIMSLLPVQIAGVKVADPTGGANHTPIARTVANTETVVAKNAQVVAVSDVDLSVADKIISVEFEPFDISDYYEGDQVFVRFELDDDGGSNTDVALLEVAVDGYKWTHGGKL